MPLLPVARRRTIGPLRAAAVLLATLALVACGQDGSDEAGVRPWPTVATTTTSTTAAPVEVVPVPVVPEPVVEVSPKPGSRPARVSVLPGVVERSAPAPRPVAARRGPAPIGRIEIPRIGLIHETFEGHSLEVLKYGPGHWTGTAMPGESSNTVFPGHRTTHTRPFWDIDKIRKGDVVVFVTSAGRFTYQATATFVVDDQETWIANGTDGPTFTIFACHPKGSARQRYVVKGDLVKAERYGSSGGGSGGGSSPTTQPPAKTTTTTTTPCVICLP